MLTHKSGSVCGDGDGFGRVRPESNLHRIPYRGASKAEFLNYS